MSVSFLGRREDSTARLGCSGYATLRALRENLQSSALKAREIKSRTARLGSLPS